MIRCCIAVIHIQPYNHTHIHAETKSTVMTNEHASFEKYTSHTLFEMVAKGLWKGYVREVSWRLKKDCNILTPSSSVFSSTSFSFCWAAQPGALVFTTSNWNNWLQTNRISCRTGLYHCLTSTCFLWASHLHLIQPVHSQGYTLISSTGCTCSLIDCWVEDQYVRERERESQGNLS